MRFIDPVYSEHVALECGKCCLLTLLRISHFSQADWRTVLKHWFSSGVTQFTLLNFLPGFLLVIYITILNTHLFLAF